MIAVVIPCYRVKDQILAVVSNIGPECNAIYVVDDACPEHTGDLVEQQCNDPRVRVLRNASNGGVGAAVVRGYRAAIEDGATVIVKLDGDGQMDAILIPRLIRPILAGAADYTKGNRFFELSGVRAMPWARLIGNAFLSFAIKISTGYWNIFDPNNGFTAIHASVLSQLDLDRVSRGYFFESDLLYRLGLVRAVVDDVPMPASYGTERSSLVIHRIAGIFAAGHVANTIKRIFYNYYLRNFNIASIELALGLALLAFGTWFGVTEWFASYRTNIPATSGKVMIAGLPIILGFQLGLAFLSYDVQNIPRDVLHRRLEPIVSKSGDRA
jgi:dolichol-phosphate mannosyltransferase